MNPKYEASSELQAYYLLFGTTRSDSTLKIKNVQLHADCSFSQFSLETKMRAILFLILQI